MDGSQRQLNHSLQTHLNRWILSATLVFAVLASLVSGWLAFNEAQEIQDTQLQQLAVVVAERAVNITLRNEEDPKEALVVQRLGDNKPLPLPLNLPDGLQTIKLQGNNWRVFVYTPSSKATPSERLAISQRVDFRNDVAWGNSLSTLLPIALLVPILMVVVSFAVHRSLRPIRLLAAVVDKRDEMRLDALPVKWVPQELLPFIESLNHLLARLRQAMHQQQRFVADAAHELRTPVTALSLLGENLANASTIENMQLRLKPLLEGLVRMRLLVTQLLDLARLQGENKLTQQVVSLQQIVQEVIAELYPLAEAKDLDLGVLHSEPLMVMDVTGNLATLVRNAIENAIRYTPTGGRVDVSLFAEYGQAILWVEDTGCGIPEAELAQVFKPFYRVGNSTEQGNGLGLTISQEIARRLGGTITLSNRSQGGLVFCYSQPLINT